MLHGLGSAELNWGAAGAIAEITAAIAVLATLVYLSLQIRKAQEAAIANALEQANVLDLSVGNQLIEHSELMVRAETGSKLSEADQIIFETIILTRRGISSRQWSRAIRLGQDSAFATGSFAAFLVRFPSARSRWQNLERGYSNSSWLEEVKAAIRHLDERRAFNDRKQPHEGAT